MYRNEVKKFNLIHFFHYKKLLVFHTKGVRRICPLYAYFSSFRLGQTWKKLCLWTSTGSACYFALWHNTGNACCLSMNNRRELACKTICFCRLSKTYIGVTVHFNIKILKNFCELGKNFAYLPFRILLG